MSKYNDFMSHIRVDDAMHRRIMNAVSVAINEGTDAEDENVLSTHFETESYNKTQVRSLDPSDDQDDIEEQAPVRRRAKVSVIKMLSIAAAAVIVTGGAVLFATRFFASGNTKTALEPRNEAAETVAAAGEHTDGITGSVSGYLSDDRYKSNDGKSVAAGKADVQGVNGIVTHGTGAPSEAEENEERTVNAQKPSTEVTSESVKGDITDALTFKVKTVGTGSLKGKGITTKVYTGENGEKAILFTAKEGTDIVNAYYPKFKGIPALLQTEGGQVFSGIDTSAGKKEQVSTSGPFDAVTWTKNGTAYMLVFNTKKDVTVFISVMEKI